MMISFILGALFAFLIPLAAMVLWKKRTHVKLKPFLVGAVCFVVFAMVLEQLLHTVCLVMDNPVSRTIKGSPLLYMLYGGLAAGIFEETARYLGFRFLLKKETAVENSVAYGIGHGGIEAILTLGMTYLLYAVAASGVSFGTAEADAAMQTAIASVTPGFVALAVMERCSAMLLHVGLSILVFYAVRKKEASMVLLAILLHACADFPAVLYQLGKASMPVVEAAIFVFACAVLAFGILIYRKLKAEE